MTCAALESNRTDGQQGQANPIRAVPAAHQRVSFLGSDRRAAVKEPEVHAPNEIPGHGCSGQRADCSHEKGRAITVVAQPVDERSDRGTEQDRSCWKVIAHWTAGGEEPGLAARRAVVLVREPVRHPHDRLIEVHEEPLLMRDTSNGQRQ